MAGDGDLVLREDLLAELLSSPAGKVWDVRGTAGAGKSELLRELERRADQSDVVVLMESEAYLTAFEQGDTAGGPGGPGGELRRFGRAARALMSGLSGRSAHGTSQGVLNDIGQAVRDPGEIGEKEAARRAEALIGQIQEKANGLIAERTAAGGRVYLLADTFEVIVGTSLENWFLRLLCGLEGAVVAVARRAGPKTADLAADGLTAVHVLEVGGLRAEQVREYLMRRLGTPGREIASAVHDFTGGHALSVGLSADLVCEMRRRGEPVTADGLYGDLIAQLKAGRDNPADVRLRRLVARFVGSAKVHDPGLGEGLDCLWVVRRFDFPLLAHLLAAGEQVSGRRIGERLIGYSFVERRSPPGRPAGQYYVVHDRVRELCLKMLDQMPSEVGRLSGTERLQVLHSAAEAYYRKHTDEVLAGYEGWFRYEDPNWQVLVREWLYHLSQLDDAGQANGRLGLAKLFFDALLWWGWYVPFGFCEELLTDWAEMVEARAGQGNKDSEEGEDSAVWGTKLRELYERCPRGWRKEAASPDDLRLVRKHLNFFLDQLEINGERRDDSRLRDVRHVRGLLSMFLARAEQLLDPRDRAIDGHLADAREMFKSDDRDEWITAWVSYEQADTALDRGDAPGAVSSAVEAGWRDLMRFDEGDFELAGRLHRVYADAVWAGGEHALALDLYARAALCAYKFQVAVGDPDIPPIDEYTQALMTEMHERTAERLAEMHAAGEDAAVREACARIRRFFDPYWDAVGAAEPADPVDLLRDEGPGEVVRRIFPPAPAAADLHQPDTEYALTAGEVLFDMEDELTQPPGTPLPAVVK